MIKTALTRWKQGTFEEILERAAQIGYNRQKINNLKNENKEKFYSIIKNKFNDFNNSNISTFINKKHAQIPNAKRNIYYTSTFPENTDNPLINFESNLNYHKAVRRVEDYISDLSKAKKYISEKEKYQLLRQSGYKYDKKYYKDLNPVFTSGHPDIKADSISPENIEYLVNIKRNGLLPSNGFLDPTSEIVEATSVDKKIIDKFKNLGDSAGDVYKILQSHGMFRTFLDSAKNSEKRRTPILALIKKGLDAKEPDIIPIVDNAINLDFNLDHFNQKNVPFKDLINSAKKQLAKLKGEEYLNKFLKDHPNYKNLAHEKPIPLDESLTEVRGHNLSGLSTKDCWVKDGHHICISSPHEGRKYNLGDNYIDSVLKGNARILEYHNPNDELDKALMYVNAKTGHVLETYGPGNSTIKDSQHFRNTLKTHNLFIDKRTRK